LTFTSAGGYVLVLFVCLYVFLRAGLLQK